MNTKINVYEQNKNAIVIYFLQDGWEMPGLGINF